MTQLCLRLLQKVSTQQCYWVLSSSPFSFLGLPGRVQWYLMRPAVWPCQGLPGHPAKEKSSGPPGALPSLAAQGDTMERSSVHSEMGHMVPFFPDSLALANLSPQAQTPR